MDGYPLVLFDGYCNLCNGAVNCIIRHDRKKQFRFVPLQSPAGKILISRFQVPENMDSVILIKNNLCFIESDAGLQIIRILGFPWNLFGMFWIIPKKIRNRIYRWIARNRYRWFAKKVTCTIPGENENHLSSVAEDL